MPSTAQIALLGIVGLGIGFVAGRLSAGGTATKEPEGKATPLAKGQESTRGREGEFTLVTLVPPLSFTGATFTDGDDQRDVVSVKVYTWSDMEHLPENKADPSMWDATYFVETTLVQIPNKPTWAASNIANVPGAKGLAFVVETTVTGSPSQKAQTINYSRVTVLATKSFGLAESRIEANGVIVNRVLQGFDDPNGPLGLDVVVDNTKEKP